MIRFSGAPPLRVSGLRDAVSGARVADIAASLRSAGPLERDGTRREGLMRWKLDWSWPTVDGNPNFSASSVRLDTQITAPCLEADGRRAAEVEARFAEYRAAILAHEMKHHAIASEEAARLATQLRALPSATDVAVGQRLGRRALGRITARNEAFDVDSDHGRSTGVRW